MRSEKITDGDATKPRWLPFDELIVEHMCGDDEISGCWPINREPDGRLYAVAPRDIWPPAKGEGFELRFYFALADVMPLPSPGISRAMYLQAFSEEMLVEAEI